MGKRPVKEEFFEMYEAHSDAVFRHCFFRVSNRQRAEDLMQETFTRAWESMKRGITMTSPKAFLFKIANNLIIDFYRSKSRSETSLDVMLEDGIVPGGQVSDDVDARLGVREILATLDQLSREEKDLIVMKHVDDLSLSDIAAALSISENAASVRIHRATKKLRELLGDTYEI